VRLCQRMLHASVVSDRATGPSIGIPQADAQDSRRARATVPMNGPAVTVVDIRDPTLSNASVRANDRSRSARILPAKRGERPVSGVDRSSDQEFVNVGKG
jgi:hypothetical protein